MMFLRHLIAVAALPVTVAVVVPLLIARRAGLSPALPAGAAEIALAVGGTVLLLAGVVLFASSLRQFVSRGRGTLAPWDPPRKLVVEGPYRYVRNPMISGVILLLFGEAAILRSGPHFLWALAFFAINAIYIPLLEEPMLEERFGDPYREYARHVGRFVPRLTPWRPEP